MPNLQASNITFLRGNTPILKGLSAGFKKGDKILIKGRNGCGKSTLLRVLAGLSRPDDGAVTWDKTNIFDDPTDYHADLHFVGHKNAIKNSLTVWENLQFWQKMTANRLNKNIKNAEQIIDYIDLKKLKNREARYLSSGQRRRVALARIFMEPRKIWFLDEPESSLDKTAFKLLDKEVDNFCAKGGIVIWATHRTNIKAKRVISL